MSVAFRAVQWNRAKLVYDAVLVAFVLLYLLVFLLAGRLWFGTGEGPVSWEMLRIRATGTCAFLMLSLVLSIGPLARLDRRFLPLLKNRRHFGVLTFLVALAHGWLNVYWFVSRGKFADFIGFMTKLSDYGTIAHFPYDTLGVVGLLVLFAMAATSHDYWLEFLTPPVWKTLHMGVYAAYGVLVMHVALGVMQTHHSPVIPVLLGLAFATVAALHLAAGWREAAIDRGTALAPDGWLPVGPPGSIPDGEARIVAAPGGERIAVFRDGRRFGAISNLCVHQNGPLGEGRIVDGCVTCPWHGYQYRLEDGCAPPPFTEKLATYRTRIRAGMVEVHPHPLPPGTGRALARWEEAGPTAPDPTDRAAVASRA